MSGASTISSPSTTSIDNTYASVQTGETQPVGATCGDATHSLWYRYTPSATGQLLIETLSGSSPDTTLAVYSGPATGQTFPGLTQVACDDDAGPGLLSKITMPVTAGTAYYIQVGTLHLAETFQLHLASGTSTNLTASAAGQTVTLQAGVVPISGTPAGNVEFLEGVTSLGSIPVTAGAASFTLPNVALGAHTYKAVFHPTGSDYLTSTSTDKSVTVTASTPPAAPAPTTTAIAAPKTVKFGKKATITVTVTGAPAGTVTLTVGGKATTLTLVNGKATLTTGKLKKPGKLNVVATYAATSTTQASSATTTIKVKKKPRRN